MHLFLPKIYNDCDQYVSERDNETDFAVSVNSL